MPPEVSSELQLGQIQHEIDFVIVDVLKTSNVQPRNQGARLPAGGGFQQRNSKCTSQAHDRMESTALCWFERNIREGCVIS